jgi:hypothetical protein
MPVRVALIASLVLLSISTSAQGASFSGTLRDGYGTPVDRATVSFTTSDGQASGVTDGLGHFRLEAATGTGTLSVWGGSSLNPVRTPPSWWVQAPMTLAADTIQDLALTTTMEMAVRVTEADGSPVQGAWVSAWRDSATWFELFPGTQAVPSYESSSGSSDGLGYVRLSYFAPINMRLITADYQPPSSFPRSVSVENVGALHDTTVTLVLPPRAGVVTFSGTLRDGNGTPVGQAMIQFDAVGRSGSGMSDEIGRFRFEAPIGPGSLLVSRNLDRGWPPPRYISHWWVRTPMALNADTVQDLSLPKPVELTIRLVEADGSPVTGFVVSARGDSIAPFELFPGSAIVGGSMPPSAVDTLQPGFVQIACFPEAWIQEISARYQPSPSSPIRRAGVRGIVALRDTSLTLVMLDAPTGTLVSLASAGYQAGAIRLLWWIGTHQQVARLYRRTRETAWQSLATLIADGTGMIPYDDAAITPGTSYGYRLGISDGATESYSGEAWVDVPALRLALYGVRPNPALSSELHVHFALPDASPASLLLYDIAGRVLQAREVGSLGAGEHMVQLRLHGPVSPGVYALRLTQGGRVLNAKAVVIR